jgi:uncharacterized repeat protein (TIGR04138 family)
MARSGSSAKRLLMQPIDFEGEVRKIIEKDNRFDREAYIFLRHALDHCHKTMLKAGKRGAGDTHVSVAELLDGIRSYALQEYGPMAMTVFNAWGLTTCEHFGDIVFSMVEHRLLSITEQDTREEFRKGYDFHEAFVVPFKPGKKIEKPAAEPSAK